MTLDPLVRGVDGAPPARRNHPRLHRDLDGYLREDFELQRILSFITVPIMVNGQWWGHVGLDDCESEREWTQAEQSVLESLAFLIGSAIELSGSSLMMSEASRLAMLRTAPDGIIVVDERAASSTSTRGGTDVRSPPGRRARAGHQRLHRAASPPRRHAHGFRRYIAGGAPVMLGRRIETEALRADGTIFPVEMALTEVVVRPAPAVRGLRPGPDRAQGRGGGGRATAQGPAPEREDVRARRLLAGIAHELNNPLSVVVGRAVMLEEDCTDARQRDQLRRLREAAERCSRIAQTFLKMARQTPADRRPTAVNAAIRAAEDLVAYGARTSGVTIVLDLSDDLPPIHADEDQIVQVWST